VRVAVDNYPRAFVFRVATSGASSDAAEQADKLAMRWIAPAAGSAFPGPGGTIPVEFQVDSPTGSFSIPSDFVEVGLDVNRDRELTGEPALQMKSDRQVTVSLDKLEPEGRMTISTLVRDFKLDLPSGMIRAKRVNLLGRVQVNGRTAWSRPVEIVLDGVGPRIVRVELKPTMGVAVKGELDATITTNDDALSGVSGVEAAVDADGSGKFSEGNKPVEAKRIASNRWSVKLPTGEIQPGEYNVIARAKDEVGNLGEFVRARFEVLGPEGLAARQVNQLRGMVTYSKVEEPQAGADVWLTAEKPGAKPLPSKPPAGKPKVPPFKSTKTSAQGEFTFVGIPPGKYKLEAELLIAGKIRKAETQIEIPPAPGKIEAVRLKIQ
jgi:hypothetical protein